MTEAVTPAPTGYKATLGILIALQSLMSINAVLLVTVNGLAGLSIAPDARLATLPVTSFVVGSALSTYFASILMARVGRRAGFMLGIGSGIVGAAVNAYAAQTTDFWLLCLGSLVLGVYGAIGQYYRFAAAEVAPREFMSRAISLVLAGGMVGGIVGPESAKLTKDLTGVPFVGAYLSLVALGFLALLVAAALRIAPPDVKTAHDRPKIGQLLRRLDIDVAVLSAAVGYAVMVFLMTATPLAMMQHQHHFEDAALVIEWHVLGMFAPSFVTGWIIKRVGVLKVIVAGSSMMIACVAVNLSGVSVAHFWLALVLLGVGWNFMFVGGTSLLAAVCSDREKAVAQGMNEVFVYGGNAVASLIAGVLLHRLGWQMMNQVAVPFLLLVLGSCFVLARRKLGSRISVS